MSPLRVFVVLLSAVLTLTAFAEAADAKKRKWRKKRVTYKAKIVKANFGLPKGTILIVNNERRLYYVLGDGKAKRYRVAVGEKIERWTGRTFVSMKRENPDWHPVDGSPKVEGGKPGNPLGKRALYLDWSLLRIHGTPKRRSIGTAVSNGCIRMYNEDVIDLYSRTHLGAPVIAVNRKRDIYKFREDKFTGKLPAWSGQAQLWKQRDKETRRDTRRARKRGMTLAEYRVWLKRTGRSRDLASRAVVRYSARRSSSRRASYRRTRRR